MRERGKDVGLSSEVCVCPYKLVSMVWMNLDGG